MESDEFAFAATVELGSGAMYAGLIQVRYSTNRIKNAATRRRRGAMFFVYMGYPAIRIRLIGSASPLPA